MWPKWLRNRSASVAPSNAPTRYLGVFVGFGSTVLVGRPWGGLAWGLDSGVAVGSAVVGPGSAVVAVAGPAVGVVGVAVGLGTTDTTGVGDAVSLGVGAVTNGDTDVADGDTAVPTVLSGSGSGPEPTAQAMPADPTTPAATRTATGA